MPELGATIKLSEKKNKKINQTPYEQQINARL